MALDLGNLPPLEITALTGRSSSHVQEFSALRCILHPAVAAALDQMTGAALNEGIDLRAVSSFRSFDRQLAIWNGKFRGQRPLLSRSGMPLEALAMDETARVDAILCWSALPGASRHHWGTDLDVIDRATLEPGQEAQLTPDEYAPGGCFETLGRWLDRHAAEFGFFRPYDLDRGGVQPEPWHCSFAPLAVEALGNLTVNVLAAALQDAALDGADVVYSRLPELHQRYVMAVAAPSDEALRAPGLINPGARPS
jgi:LAS superfamily LD-carboxypeptidase LdcB